MQVSLHGRLGWIHYRKGLTEYLRPLQGFDWNHLHIQEDLTYYRGWLDFIDRSLRFIIYIIVGT